MKEEKNVDGGCILFKEQVVEALKFVGTKEAEWIISPAGCELSIQGILERI